MVSRHRRGSLIDPHEPEPQPWAPARGDRRNEISGCKPTPNELADKARAMILILTEPSDAHADHVADKLRARGTDFVRFNPADFPSHAEISLSYGPTGRV